MRKLEDLVIYRDEAFYAAFPSVVSRPDGELLVAFRRAPERRHYFAGGITHTDPNSYLVLVRSRDLGRTWSREPELIYAHPLGGSQDPCMVQLDDGSLLLSSYAWMLLPEGGLAQAEPGGCLGDFGWHFTFLGGYLLRSADAGRTWQGPILPPEGEGVARAFPGVPLPSANRGAFVQARDGALYWLVARARAERPHHTVLALLVSRDRGLTWEDRGVVAEDERVVFNETSLVETAGGDLVGFIRTEDYDDHGAVVRSRDGGRTWQGWQDTGIVGHPYHALRLPDERVFLVYGYRHQPFGIRARVLDPECTCFDTPEIVLRDEGGGPDLGYPWACLTAEGQVLVVYYFRPDQGTRFIAGTFLEIA